MIEGGSFFESRSRETTITIYECMFQLMDFMSQTDFSIGNHLYLYYLIYDY